MPTMSWVSRMKKFPSLALPLLLLTLAGCATMSEPRIHDDRSSLVVVEVDGRVDMSWNSKKGRSYTVLYSDRKNAPINEWRALPGYIDIKGSGGTMTARDLVPKGINRNYRLRTAVE